MCSCGCGCGFARWRMLTLILRGYGYIGYTQIGRVAYPREEDSPRIVRGCGYNKQRRGVASDRREQGWPRSVRGYEWVKRTCGSPGEEDRHRLQNTDDDDNDTKRRQNHRYQTRSRNEGCKAHTGWSVGVRYIWSDPPEISPPPPLNPVSFVYQRLLDHWVQPSTRSPPAPVLCVPKPESIAELSAVGYGCTEPDPKVHPYHTLPRVGVPNCSPKSPNAKHIL